MSFGSASSPSSPRTLLKSYDDDEERHALRCFGGREGGGYNCEQVAFNFRSSFAARLVEMPGILQIPAAPPERRQVRTRPRWANDSARRLLPAAVPSLGPLKTSTRVPAFLPCHPPVRTSACPPIPASHQGGLPGTRARNGRPSDFTSALCRLSFPLLPFRPGYLPPSPVFFSLAVPRCPTPGRDILIRDTHSPSSNPLSFAGRSDS